MEDDNVDLSQLQPSLVVIVRHINDAKAKKSQCSASMPSLFVRSGVESRFGEGASGRGWYERWGIRAGGSSAGGSVCPEAESSFDSSLSWLLLSSSQSQQAF